MPQHAVRNRVAAGAFMLLALAAALVVLVLVGKWDTWLEKTQTVHFRFRAAPNVKKGSPVLLAGYPIGQVVDCYPVEAESPAAEKRGKYYLVEVVASVPQKYPLHKNARVTITQALVGQSASLNIEDVGSDQVVTAADSILGGEASAFTEAAGEVGIGDKERASITQIIESVRAVTASLKTDMPDIVQKLKTTGDNLVEGSKKIKEILDENRENLKSTVASAKSVTEKADKGADEILTNTRVATAQVRDIVDKNSEDIRQTVVHVRNVAEKADRDAGAILANAHTASGDLKTAVADLRIIAADAKGLLVTHKGAIASTLQNFRETSEHLRALAKEVRRAPWRLFATPDKQEVETLNLYDSARAFASAATDLDNLADTLQTMVEAKKEGIDVDPEVIKGMLKRLEETFGTYQEAEKALQREFERIQK